MDEILTAESLIVAVIGIFFGLWYAEINEASKLNTYRFLYGKKRKVPYVGLPLPNIQLMKIGFMKISSLFIVQFVMSLIFLPNVINSIMVSVRVLMSSGVQDYFTYYSTVNTSFLFIWLMLIAMLVYSLFLLVKIKMNINGCNYARAYISKLR